VALSQFRATGFRCLEATEFEPHPRLTCLSGANASGKTSVLEAIFYLGRGRSFRAGSNRELLQEGAEQFALFGRIDAGADTHRAGVEVEPGQRRVRVDGENAAAADLARVLPVQAIDPEIHNLVQGGPEFRRRFLDWGVFHVKHEFLGVWQRYQTALKQRNAALRQGFTARSIRSFEEEVITAGEHVARLRADYFSDYMQFLSPIVDDFLPFAVKCSYLRGWPEGASLLEALEQTWDGDQARGTTHRGPHRAELKLEVQSRRARYRVSRGQQKLLAAAMIIAQVRQLAAAMSGNLVLLVDDPSAELDPDNRRRLFALLADVPAQLFVAALDPADLPVGDDCLRLDIEHGRLATLV